MSNGNVCFADSQGNNGRPGKPGDRGTPGPQVRDFLLNRETETQTDTGRHLNCKYEYFWVIFLFFFLLQGARGFPGTPGLPGMKGHRVSVDFFPCLAWTPLTCSKQPKLLQNREGKKNGGRWAPCVLCKMWTKLFWSIITGTAATDYGPSFFSVSCGANWK